MWSSSFWPTLLLGLSVRFTVSTLSLSNFPSIVVHVEAWVPVTTHHRSFPSRRRHQYQSKKSSSPLPFLFSSKTGQYDYDLAVIGGGVVGVQAALCAASAPYSRKVCLIDAPREAGVLMVDDEDLSIGAPTGLFSKALRDTSKRIKVSTLRGMGLRDDRCVNTAKNIDSGNKPLTLVTSRHTTLISFKPQCFH